MVLDVMQNWIKKRLINVAKLNSELVLTKDELVDIIERKFNVSIHKIEPDSDNFHFKLEKKEAK